MRRRWIKLWVQETLYGTTSKELEPAERAVWFGLLALAGDSPSPGMICLAPGVAYQETQLCQVLRVPQETLTSALAKMTEAGKVSRNGDGCFSICNWARYQPSWDEAEYHREYMREWQKDDRAKKKMLMVVDSQHVKPSLPEETRPEETIYKKKVVRRPFKVYHFTEEERREIVTLLDKDDPQSVNGELMSVLLEVPVHWGKTPKDCVWEYNKVMDKFGHLDYPILKPEFEKFRISSEKYNWTMGWVALRNWLARVK